MLIQNMINKKNYIKLKNKAQWHICYQQLLIEKVSTLTLGVGV